ncbi:hypothetical protein B0T10DRAFT_456355 [Thelonectria olida]|uniref:Uncharacterized protein n=1 Tax=Thelonectria olida TaxID=1576542 RepID=A0A9P9AV90_9HYPO|nr:hypothetical protein B0T10DRAFT_456355 [Thelonectria olida]
MESNNWPEALTLTMDTPSTASELLGSPDAVPWQGNTYMILEKGTNRAMTFHLNRAHVEDLDEALSNKEDQIWLCVEKNGYLGFHYPPFGGYLSCGEDFVVHARSQHLSSDECFTLRHHPSGGYQLLSKLDGDKLWMVVTSDEGETLEVREHGMTLWVFKKVSAS